MVNILELLEKRTQYPLVNKLGDTWVDDVLAHHRDEKEQWIVVPTGFLAHRLGYFSKQCTELFGSGQEEYAGGYYLVSLFDVENPYRGISIPFTLICLSKTKPNTVKIANYKGEVRSLKRRLRGESFTVSKDLVEKYTQQYLAILQKWSNLGVIPHGSENQDWELCEIPYENFDFTHPYPGYYMKSRTALRNLLKETDVVPLSAVAEIIAGPIGRKVNGPVFRFSDAKYPFNWKKVKTGICSEIVIQKGDILVPRSGNLDDIYLFNEDSEQDLYAPLMSIIVRPKTLPPEFLFLYLKGETGQDLPGALSDITEKHSVLLKISKESLSEYPVLRKMEDPELYMEYFRLRYLHDAELGDFNVFLGKHKIGGVEDVIRGELVERLRFYKTEKVLSLIKRDVDELNICYKNGAYKATLIMAGSILEALAIDWVSEMYKEDYFKGVDEITKCREFYKYLIEHNGKQPELYHYIEVIRKHCPKIRVPDWMTPEMAKTFNDNATEIRKKRNLVHAKLCLKECETINQNLCNRVIGYLKEIIRIRFGKDV